MAQTHDLRAAFGPPVPRGAQPGGHPVLWYLSYVCRGPVTHESETGGAVRVAFITTSYPRTSNDPHGHFVARVAEGLIQHGVSVTAYAPHEAGALERETLGGVEVVRFRYAPGGFERVAYGSGVVSNVRSQPRAALALPAFIVGIRRATNRAAKSADIIHAHWAQTALVAGAGTRGIPMALTIHGSDLQLARSKRLEWTLRRPLKQAAVVMAVSAELAEQLQPYMPAGVTPRVVHGGVEASLLEAPVERRDPTGRPLELLFVGRLVPEKGIFDLIDALKQVRTGFRLTVVGVGPHREEMERKIRGAGIDNVVAFTGALAHEQLIERMRSSDIVIMPSHREGCGLVPIEAAAVGTPVIVTRTGAMPEVVDCPDAIVDPRDVAGLTRAIKRMMDDPDLRERCARSGRSLVREEFIWDRIVDQTLAVYEEIAGRRR